MAFLEMAILEFSPSNSILATSRNSELGHAFGPYASNPFGLRASMDRIAKTARDIIDAVESGSESVMGVAA
jgi:hypothetical protein